jgi:hypothetical protein
MSVVHRITGYDRVTEALTEQHTVPLRLVPAAKAAAQINADDPEAVWSYPLGVNAVHRLATAMHVVLDTAHNDYFLEAFAAPQSGTSSQAA